MGICGDSGYFVVVDLGLGFLIRVFVFSNLDLEEISLFWLWVFGWLVGGGVVVIGVRFWVGWVLADLYYFCELNEKKKKKKRG